MKCEICNSKIDQTFLKKRIGTIIKDNKGKKYDICANCQKQFKTKEEILNKL